MPDAINNNGSGRDRFGAKLRSWRPELPDPRDYPFTASGIAIRDRVASLGHARGVRIHDQGQTSACTGHGSTTAVETSLGLHGDAVQLSRLYPYYWGRFAIGEAHLDNGAYNRDVIKSIAQRGCPTESKWKFNVANIIVPPSKTAEKDAAARLTTQFAGIQYQRCSSVDQMVAAINDGCGVMFGFIAFENIFGLDKKNYTLPMPGANDMPVGGHAVCADGYSVPDRYFEIANSWGVSWGNGGHFRMPFEWFTDPRRLCDDIWAIVPATRIPVPG